MDVEEQTAPIDELVIAVKNAIKVAGVSATNGDRDLRVTTVQLILNAVATTKIGGGVDFRIPVIGWKVKAGAARTTQRTHTIDIALVPEGPMPRFEVRDRSVERTLVDAIRTVRAAVAAAAGGDDPFVLQTGTVELIFAVTGNGAISLGIEGELADEITHTLKLGLEPVAR